MKLESTNQTGLSLGQVGDSLFLDSSEISLIHVRITQSREITPNGSDALFVYGWIAIAATKNGLALYDDEVAGSGTVVDPGTTGTPSTFSISNPIVTQGLTVDQEVFIKSRGLYSFVYAEPRGAVDVTTNIFDVIGGGSGSSGVKSVQCVSNMLVVGY
jgi:hypothetical protein